VRAQEAQEAVELAQMSPAERAFAEEGPFEHAVDSEVNAHLGTPDDADEPGGPDDPDGPDHVLTGLGS
jgi:hypothetical protein